MLIPYDRISHKYLVTYINYIALAFFNKTLFIPVIIAKLRSSLLRFLCAQPYWASCADVWRQV